MSNAMGVDRRFFMRAMLYVSCALTFSSCTCQENGPRDPVWQKDTCAHCRMTISEKRFAAQVVGPGAQWQYFDDLGCAMKKARDHNLDENQLYVFQDNKWVKAKGTRYNSGFKTPMNSGFAPVADGAMSYDDMKKALLASDGTHHE